MNRGRLHKHSNALIGLSVAGLLLVSQAGEAVAGPDLSGTELTVSQNTLAPGERLTCTITLRNSGNADTLADVAAPIPNRVAYVTNSATGAALHPILGPVWEKVPVAAGASVALTFQVTPVEPVIGITDILSLALINSVSNRFILTAAFALLPATLQAPPELAASDVVALKPTISQGEEVTYAITVRNSGANALVVDVSNRVPEMLDYVPGSVTGGGYDPVTRTLTWKNVSVPAGGSVPLTFRVTTHLNTLVPQRVTNAAVITSGGVSFSRVVSVYVVMR